MINKFLFLVAIALCAVANYSCGAAAYMPQFKVDQQVEADFGQAGGKKRVTIVKIVENKLGDSDGQFYVVINEKGEEYWVLRAQLETYGGNSGENFKCGWR